MDLYHQELIAFVTCSAADVKELEKAIVNLVRAENSDIKQKQDQARLHIHHCQLVLVNTYSQTASNPTEVKDSPLTQVTAKHIKIITFLCSAGPMRNKYLEFMQSTVLLLKVRPF